MTFDSFCSYCFVHEDPHSHHWWCPSSHFRPCDLNMSTIRFEVDFLGQQLMTFIDKDSWFFFFKFSSLSWQPLDSCFFSLDFHRYLDSLTSMCSRRGSSTPTIDRGTFRPEHLNMFSILFEYDFLWLLLTKNQGFFLSIFTFPPPHHLKMFSIRLNMVSLQDNL